MTTITDPIATTASASSTDRPTTATRSRRPIDLVDPTQACHLLGVDSATLLAMVNRGQVDAFELDGLVRFRRSDLVTGIG